MPSANGAGHAGTEDPTRGGRRGRRRGAADPSARKWWKRPRAGERAEPPRWTASLDDATAGRAMLLGALLSGANVLGDGLSGLGR
ncbi:hypothetical protein [Streptomyces goshikiensis]|uniref:hypothetical protein n=1 Tax=Streptomyces goshikiensis TaxID=1942 RepID=UPI0036C4B27A